MADTNASGSGLRQLTAAIAGSGWRHETCATRCDAGLSRNVPGDEVGFDERFPVCAMCNIARCRAPAAGAVPAFRSGIECRNLEIVGKDAKQQAVVIAGQDRARPVRCRKDLGDALCLCTTGHIQDVAEVNERFCRVAL